MITSEGLNNEIEIKDKFESKIHADLVIVGGGIAGVCASISAAREGLRVILVQDRPVLGGNASSEVRLWILGATSHMGNNNRWAREGGVIDEILIENMYRNPEGNAVIFDTILLDKVISESNITLLLNTVVFDVIKLSKDSIKSVIAFCSQNQILYNLEAPLFIDASGDGIVGLKSGAAFRMGAESKNEFDEKFAPEKEYGELLGHSLYFYSKDVGKPVKFIPPSYALNDIKKIPRYKNFNTSDFGCRLWWIEYGGRLDTIKDTELIKWELWKVVYGVWNYIKNSGNFPDTENLTLEWVGTIPGKRESRRFEGDYILKQQDIIEQRKHYDAIAFGGWSIDLHPANGVYSDKPGCNQWHSKGIYQIPYRSIYSRNITNLLLAGRLISATHVAFGSTRVMATCGALGQAAACAAILSNRYNISPKEIANEKNITDLQQLLLKQGTYIPGIKRTDKNDLVQNAEINASSEYILSEFKDDKIIKPLESSVAQMIPLQEGLIPSFVIKVFAADDTDLSVELRVSQSSANYTPEVILEHKTFSLKRGTTDLQVEFEVKMAETAYAYLVILQNPKIHIHYSSQRVTGVLSVFNHKNPAVSNNGYQNPPADIGIDKFEFWCPKRRPEGYNIALKTSAPIKAFGVNNLKNGISRPTNQPNAWVADINDENPTLEISWDTMQDIRVIEIDFDSDFDHPMESVLMGHPERVMPFCIRQYIIQDECGIILAVNNNNYQTRNTIHLNSVYKVKKLIFKCKHPSKEVPASLFSIRCFS